MLRTVGGVTLGSPRGEVRAAYPGQLQKGPPSPFPVGSLTVIRGDFSGIWFDFDAQDRVMANTSGQGGCAD